MSVTYIRVKDKTTGHRFDVSDQDPRIREGLFIPLNRADYPPSTVPRPMKPRLHHIQKPPRR